MKAATLYGEQVPHRLQLSSARRRLKRVRVSGEVIEPLERRVLLSAISPPTHLVGVPAEGDGGLQLSWDAVPGAVAYDVESAPAGSGKFVTVAADSTFNNEVVDTSGQPTMRWDYRVRAFDQDGNESAPSKVLTVVVPLNPPLNVGATSTSPSRIDLTWDMNNGDPPSSVEIDRSTDGIHFSAIALVPPGTTHFTDVHVDEATGYFYTLPAVRGRFRSVSQFAGGYALPKSPVGLAARTPVAGSVDLSWRNVSRHADGIDVFVRQEPDTDFQLLGTTLPLDPTTTSFSYYGLEPGKTYQFYVVSQVQPQPPTDSPVGVFIPPVESLPSNIVTVTLPPDAVTNVMPTPVSANEIDLSWDGVIRGATGIDVFRSTDDRTFRKLTTSPLPATARSFESTGLSPDTHYYYELRAYLGGGKIARTPVDSSSLPLPPTNLKATVLGFREVDLTWTSHGSPDTTFVVLSARAGTGYFSEIATVNSTHYEARFTQPGQVVDYEVQAMSADGLTSLPSNVVRATQVGRWDGFPDPHFGRDGLAGHLLPFTSPQAVALQGDGKILIGGADLNTDQSAQKFALTRLNADGSLDETFGSDGRVTTPVGTFSGILAIAVQRDGKIVVAGVGFQDFALSVGGSLVVARYLANGTLDRTFGSGGIEKPDTMLAENSAALAIEPDGKILAAGVAQGQPQYQFALTRLTSSGQPDPTFGSRGTASIPIGPFQFQPGTAAVRVAADGKIVVAGGESVARFTTAGALDRTFGKNGLVGGLPATIDDAAALPDGRILVRSTDTVYRLTPQGALDRTFGTHGTASAPGDGSLLLRPGGTIVAAANAEPGLTLTAFTPSGSPDPRQTFDSIPIFSDGPEKIPAALEPDGKIVAVGEANGFAAARVTTSGQLDPSFGYRGVSAVPDGLSGGATAVALQGNQIIAAGGEVDATGLVPAEAGLVRYNPDGTIDTRFGTKGRALLSGQPGSHFNALAVQPDGGLVAAGDVNLDGVIHFIVARFLSDGRPDPAFGSHGAVETDLPGLLNETWSAVAVQKNGDIVAVGSAATGTDPSVLVAARYLPSGALDPTFGNHGDYVLGSADVNTNSAAGVSILPDGRILIGGTIDGNFGLLRLTADGKPDATFGPGGMVHTFFGGGSIAYAMTTDSKGRIILGGFANSDTPALARYLSDGRLDPTFGAGGTMRVTQGLAPGGGTILSLAAQADGRIIAGSGGQLAVARFNDRGLDESFGLDGVTPLNDPASDGATSVALDRNGDILVATFGVWRLRNH